MAVTQYIGSRYVPLFADPAEWSSEKSYEPLTIVLHEGNSYTSKQAVPVGIDIDNEVYWALTGNYNAQVEAYRRETANALATAQDAQNDINTLLPKSDFSADNTVKKYINDYVDEQPDCFIDNITYQHYRKYNTDIYVATIPVNDSNGNQINPYISFSESSTGITPTKYAQNNATTFTCNGALNVLKTDGTWQVPNIISNGEIIFGSPLTGTPSSNRMVFLAINRDRSVSEYPITADGANMIANGALVATTTFCKIVNNSSAVNLDGLIIEGVENYWLEKNPNVCFGVKNDNTIVILCCDGRLPNNDGMDFTQLQTEMIALGCSRAWIFDGGGSSSFNYRCVKMNRNIDENNTVDRMIRFALNFKKSDAPDFLIPNYQNFGAAIQEKIIEANQNINSRISVVNTSENILEAVKNQDAYMVIYRYTGTDTSWTPRNQDYSYGMFIGVRNANLAQCMVIGTRYNSSDAAIASYANDRWYNWFDIEHRIPTITTSENILELAAVQEESFAIYIYTGSDTSWTPAGSNYTYGIFTVAKIGSERIVNAYTYNGIMAARNSYSNNKWYGWHTYADVRYQRIARTYSIPAGTGRDIETLNLSSPANESAYVISAMCSAESLVLSFTNRTPSSFTLHAFNAGNTDVNENVVYMVTLIPTTYLMVM